MQEFKVRLVKGGAYIEETVIADSPMVAARTFLKRTNPGDFITVSSTLGDAKTTLKFGVNPKKHQGLDMLDYSVEGA